MIEESTFDATADSQEFGDPRYLVQIRDEIRERARGSPRLTPPLTRSAKLRAVSRKVSNRTRLAPALSDPFRSSQIASGEPIQEEGENCAGMAHQPILREDAHPLGKYTAIPEAYDGTTDFGLWLKQYEICSLANGWDEQQKRRILPTRLTGKAFFAYADLAPDVNQSFADLTLALRLAIHPPELQNALRMEFRERKKGASETLDTFFQGLVILCQQAYPEMPLDAQMQLVKDQFLQGLSWTLRDRVMQARPKTAAQALTIAREQSAWLASAPAPQPTPDLSAVYAKLDQLTDQLLAAKRQAEQPIPAMQTMAPIQPQVPFTCWTCGGLGHRSRDCRSRMPRNYAQASPPPTRYSQSNRFVPRQFMNSGPTCPPAYRQSTPAYERSVPAPYWTAPPRPYQSASPAPMMQFQSVDPTPASGVQTPAVVENPVLRENPLNL